MGLFPFVCCFCFIRAFSFQGRTKIALSLHSVTSSFQSYSLSFAVYSISFHSLPIYGNSIPLDSIHCLFHSNLFHSIYCLFSVKFHSIPLHCSLSIKSIPISFIVELISFHYSISVSITVIVPLYLLNFLPLSNVFRCPACVF